VLFLKFNQVQAERALGFSSDKNELTNNVAARVQHCTLKAT